jgi:60 kDa SS-A/Ro ribonucleoprotein
LMLALDLSASMTWETIAGVQGVTPRVASAAMALVTARSEQTYLITGFTSSGSWLRDSSGISEMNISPRQRLDDVVKTISGTPAGGTDCALPMIYATKHKLPLDGFIVYTDNETWAGSIHPSQALQEYRQKMGIPARLAVVGMTSTGFSIADPEDAGQMDVVGFDTAAPRVLGDFMRGRI